MQYNSSRTPLIIPEHGRNIQQLVDHCKTIEDKTERSNCAIAIVSVLGNLNPHLRDVPEFQHKLWDQLFIMAEFDLDVDSPFPIPKEEEIRTRPKKIPYPKVSNKFRYYGNNVKRMIEVADTWDNEEKKEALVYNVANQMKKSYVKWNKDQVDDSTIFQHIKVLSDGKIDWTDTEEELMSTDFIKQQIGYGNKNRGKKKKG